MRKKLRQVTARLTKRFFVFSLLRFPIAAFAQTITGNIALLIGFLSVSVAPALHKKLHK